MAKQKKKYSCDDRIAYYSKKMKTTQDVLVMSDCMGYIDGAFGFSPEYPRFESKEAKTTYLPRYLQGRKRGENVLFKSRKVKF